MTDKALAERLRKLAQAYRSVVVVDVTSINEATDLERAADLIESITTQDDWQMVPTTVLQSSLRALEESVDLVQSEYDTNWRQGMPTRKKQLDTMLAELNNHKDAIELLKKFAGDSNE